MSYSFSRAINVFTAAVTQQYWDVKGRTSRTDYWHYVSITFIAGFVIGFIAGLIGVPFVADLFSLALLAPGIGMIIRRMHDIGKSWWFSLIPLYNLYLACQPGDKGSNLYGEDPLGNPADAFA
ncbi:MAG: DUF805 domain-containing protein [Pseudomonadota bacterium]